jgi:hypothetical protein
VCTDGECDAPTSDWLTFQHDVAHTGVAEETGKPPLTWAWSRELSLNGPPAVASGRVFTTSPTYFGDASPLSALNLSDGTDLWSYNFGSVFSVGTPSVFDGHVYVANGKGTSSPPAYVWSFEAATGTVEWAAQMSAQWETYWAPIRVGNVVYSNGGTYGGLYGFDTTDGTQKFFLSSLEQYDEWSASYGLGYLFTFVAGHFRKHDPLTGTVLNTVNMDWSWNGWSMGTAAAIGDAYAFMIASPNLVAVNPATNAIAWTSNGNYKGVPAVDGNSVYAISAGNLVVRSATNGSLLWTFVGDSAFVYPPVVANGYVYVSSEANVYAVDTTTHASVWSASKGGHLVLAGRRLLVAGSSELDAYVLSP